MHTIDFKRTTFICCFCFLLTAVFSVHAEKKYVNVSLVANQTQVVGGETIALGIIQDIEPKWHVYWVNPGDSGEATEVYWSGLDGIKAAPLQWPIPHKIPYGPLTNYGYEDQVVLLQELTLPEKLPDEAIELVADISLLVCEEICLPEFHQATLVLNGAQSAAPGVIERAQFKLPVEQNWPASYSLVNEQVVLNVDYDAEMFVVDAMKNIELFYTERGVVNNSAIASSSHDQNNWQITQKAGDVSADGIAESGVVVVFEDLSGQRSGIQLAAKYQANQPVTSDVSLIYAIGLALLGGILLNVMPCVFPVLALKAMSLVHMQESSNQKARMHGWAYTAGILLSFLVIAVLLLALKSLGAQIGWGFQLQNPLFVMFLIYLLSLVALNLAGFFEFGTGLTNVGSGLAQKHGLSGSFYTGVLATLVATPCTAPFMGVAIGYALVQPFYVSLVVFLSLGFGLALPYLLLSLFPKTRSWLPQPGQWMMKFKEFLAFPMFATVAWLIWVLSFQAANYSVLMVLMGLVVLSLGIWMLQLNSRMKYLGWVFLLVSFWPFYAVYQNQQNSNETANWEAFNNSTYQQALARDEAIFVNMTAAWCITCQVNEQVALNTNATKKLFLAEKIQYLKGDWTDFDAEITQYLEKYQRNGVPIYVFYGPVDENTGQRPEPKVLPQILTPAIIEDAIINHDTAN